jgi:glucokinase
MSEIVLGIDLGGTRIKAVAIDGQGNILHQQHHPTNDGDDAIWKHAVAQTVRELQSKTKCSDTIIGIAAPGLPNEGNSAIAFMPGRLQGLEDFVWTGFLKAPTFILNDAIAAMMAEARFGVAKNRKNVVMLTLGTGVGGAILIEGKPYQGAFNKAGHIGHMVIDSDGEPDCIGIPGSLEDAIGNCTIEKRTSGKFGSTHEMLEAVRKGDNFASGVWLTSVRKLAIGLAALTNILSPEMIILGGGITEAGSDLFDPLEEYMSNYEWRAGDNKTTIVKAQFGDMAGAVGAACFAREIVTK